MRAVGVTQAARRCVGRLAAPDVERAQHPHRHAQFDVDDVVTRATPLGKPALSPPITPNRLWMFAGVGGIAVLSRNCSDTTTLGGWFNPGTPVRKAATKSVRGKLVGALTPAPPNSTSSSIGSVGLVT